jgi:hypothetical protein
MKYLSFLILICFSGLLQAQTRDSIKNHSPISVEANAYKPIIIKLNDDGSKYMRFQAWSQAWFSVNQNNPGTLDVNGNAQKTSTEFALRRSRMVWSGQFSPRIFFLMHIGINNQGFNSGGFSGTDGKKPQLHVHDAATEFAVIAGKLSIGGRLHFWSGGNRMASPSTITFATLDAPIFNWYNFETNDQTGRQLGVYAKGQIGRFDYRVSVNKPYVSGKLGGAPKTDLAVNNATLSLYPAANSTLAEAVKTEQLSTQGYVAYQFFDKEANKLPYTVGTYIGTKKVVNLGIGWNQQNQSTGRLLADIDTLGISDTLRNFSIANYNQQHIGIDVYIDMPVGQKEKKGCLHVYGLVQLMQYGPNYVRNFGVLNSHTGSSTKSFNGSGNAQPTMGTGTIGYLQLGYALPAMKNGQQIMPYINLTHKQFDALKDPSTQYDLGLNYFISGHNAKITAQYGTRPVYNTDKTLNGYKGQFVLQSQIAI